MKLIQFLLLSFLAAAGMTISNAYAGESLATEYTCNGKDSGEGAYSEKMQLTARPDNIYGVKFVSDDPYMGVGHLSADGKKLYVSWVKAGNSKANGLLILDVNPTKLEGKYAEFNSQGGLEGQYTCTKA